MSAPDIFISYNREDAGVAKLFADAFVREGLEVWWDVTLHSGEAYDEVTENALHSAKAVVVLWSPRSVSSRWVRAEATVADQNKTLVPVTIEACRRPVMFELIQTADLSHWRGEADDVAWLAFLGDLERIAGRGSVKQTVALPEAAPATRDIGPTFVALLPITHRSDNGEMEILAEELTEEITRELAQNTFFRVIAAPTIKAWRTKGEEGALRDKFELAYLIEGKLKCTGQEIRLTVQLIDTTTGAMLKSKRFSCNCTDIADSPDDFPLEVGTQLGEAIVQIEMDRAMSKPGPYSGWEHILRSTALHSRISSDSLRMALEEARQAVTVAPELGLAHALLAANLGSPVTTAGEAIGDPNSGSVALAGRGGRCALACIPGRCPPYGWEGCSRSGGETHPWSLTGGQRNSHYGNASHHLPRRRRRVGSSF